MAFTLAAIVGSTTVTLSDNNPFGLLGARGMGGAPVRRVTTRGPTQDGDTDLGYRLQPREVELVIGFRADTDAALDTHRDTLTSIFKPLTSTPVYLRVTRDDGEVRQLECHAVGEIVIRLLPEDRAAHYHRATVKLRAPDPAYYAPTPGTTTYTGSVSYATNWHLAGGNIGSAQVLMVGATPALSATWSYAGTLSDGDSWTLALRAAYVSSSGTEAYMFRSTLSTAVEQPRFGKSGTIYGSTYYRMGNNELLTSGAMSSGTQSYMYNSDPDGLVYNSVQLSDFRSTWLVNGTVQGLTLSAAAVRGTAMQWRALGWSGAIAFYALYSPALTEGQRQSLLYYMASNISTSVNISYDGNLPEYPVIRLTGPITSPVITNAATNERLDFGTITIGAGTTYEIDTRYGYKTVKMGTVDKRFELSDDSDLATWHLAPSPLATGGTNFIVAEGSSIGTATSLSVIYYNRYSSY